MSPTQIPSSVDYIVVGGGTGGLSFASRLSSKCPHLTVLVLEASPDQTSHPLTQTPDGAFAASESEVDWNYSTIPQTQFNDREIQCTAGKSLSGATAVNYGLWTRGPKNDFDRWAELTSDSNWSYESFLPYFRGLETYNAVGNADQHGSDGPIHAVSVTRSDVSRRYPLRENLEAAWRELGVSRNPDYNGGDPLGLGELVENWRDGRRQPASRSLDLSHVQIACEKPVERILLEAVSGETKAVGVQLVDGSRVRANREVIVATGAYRTPGLLMLSGIGPAATLKQHGIPVVVNNPEVGENYFDHLSVPVYFTAAHPEQNVALGSPAWFTEPAYAKGLPFDFITWESIPTSSFAAAVEHDAKNSPTTPDPLQLTTPKRVHTETITVYGPVAKLGQYPFDGTIITSAILNMQPTSRGTVTIASSNPSDKPIINPRFYTTETDRAITRYGVRRMLQVLTQTAGGREMVNGQVPPGGIKPLTDTSSDEEVDAHVRALGTTWNHAAGTAGMQTKLRHGVVDSRCKVLGVNGLRIVDASVLPVPIASHYQALIYALGWKVADFVAAEGAAE